MVKNSISIVQNGLQRYSFFLKYHIYRHLFGTISNDFTDFPILYIYRIQNIITKNYIKHLILLNTNYFYFILFFNGFFATFGRFKFFNSMKNTRMALFSFGLPFLFYAFFPFSGTTASDRPRYLDSTDFAADPAAHVFDGKIHVYCTRDWASPVSDRTDGNHYDMREYTHFAIDSLGNVARHDAILTLEQVPWASKQLWACDIARRDSRYYLYFPAKDRQGLFRIGVAIGQHPEGPFVPDPAPIEGTYSIDPAIFDDNGTFYICFGGLQGGQLQRYADNRLLEQEHMPAPGQQALAPRIARLSDDMRSLAEPPRPIVILDTDGNPLKADDPHRFFEAAWLHKHNDTYYFTYSTGSTHLICYATGDSPYGPFTCRGVVLTPVVGWTTHQSVCEYNGKWYLFFHDCVPSGGISSLRSAKYCELIHEPDGSIRTIEGKPGEERKTAK